MLANCSSTPSRSWKRPREGRKSSSTTTAKASVALRSIVTDLPKTTLMKTALLFKASRSASSSHIHYCAIDDGCRWSYVRPCIREALRPPIMLFLLLLFLSLLFCYYFLCHRGCASSTSFDILR
ncbi:hypothetical protein BJ508DRAFT_109283 [Ascobolus immersus RN42]|uniref:Uncharacterized protein n=1 Tax=Ascobolus immersus RN42 TaxID=1160509 RepID=A0A3N4HCY6_ASCIM|nr:hypothetical protein BJ508DRAFT_109283 [Ascobolus immersus RN42]